MVSSMQEVAKTLVAPGKGILAADESPKSANKRLAALGIAETEANRRRWRNLLFTTPGMEQYLSGVILHDETFRQSSLGNEVAFVDLLQHKNILPGIKVDQGLVPMPASLSENYTEGLDGLRERLQEYAGLGAKFAKWRTLFVIDGESLPSEVAMNANLHSLSMYAAMAQENHLVPIVEPEVLYDGSHSLARAQQVITVVLKKLFERLQLHGVDASAVLLKSSMVLAGKQSAEKTTPEQIAQATLEAFHASVPKQVAGIVFLSGGQGPVGATQNLNAISLMGAQPWPITFSFSRALQDPVMRKWAGDDINQEAAQAVFLKRLANTAAALKGEYDIEMDNHVAV